MTLSLGGMTRLALALGHFDLIERVVCCDARAAAPDVYKAIWDTNIAATPSRGMEAVIESTMPRWFSPAFHASPTNTMLLASMREAILTTPADGCRKAARCLRSLDLLKDLDHLGGADQAMR